MQKKKVITVKNIFMDTQIRNEITSKTNSGFKSKEGKRLVITIIIALVLIAGLWAWKTIQINHIRDQAQKEQLQLQEKVKSQMREIDENNLKVLAKPFVWAIRTEMLKNNVSQIALYINDIVKERSFQKINIVNEKGIVILSTNKKEEGGKSSMTEGGITLSAENTEVSKLNDSIMTMSSPIMGFNSRLGTLLINYSSKHPALAIYSGD